MNSRSRAGCLMQYSMFGLQFVIHFLFLDVTTFWSWMFYGDVDTKASNVTHWNCFTSGDVHKLLFLVCIASSNASFIAASSVYISAIESRNIGEISAHRITVNTTSDVKNYFQISSSEKCYLILVLKGLVNQTCLLVIRPYTKIRRTQNFVVFNYLVGFFGAISSVGVACFGKTFKQSFSESVL